MKTTPLRAKLMAASLFLSAIPLLHAAPETPPPAPPPPGQPGAPGGPAVLPDPPPPPPGAVKPSPGPGIHPPKPEADHRHEGKITELLAIIGPSSNSNVRGSVLFEQSGPDVKVTVKVGGLTPNSQHAIHIHEFGNISSADGTSAGGHYNPEGHPHGLPDSDKDKRHPGDFGNLQADGDGNATLTLTVAGISLGHGKNAIIGRSIVIHAKPDDGGQPVGNAGDRIGVGVIGVSKVEKVKE